MERTLESKGKTYKITNNSIQVDKFVLTPGEVPKIANLLGIAGSMASLRALPPEIIDEPFSIEFKEDGNHELIRNSNDNSVSFTFEQVDDMVSNIQMALDVSLDLQKIAPKKIPQYQGALSADIIEGRG